MLNKGSFVGGLTEPLLGFVTALWPPLCRLYCRALATSRNLVDLQIVD